MKFKKIVVLGAFLLSAGVLSACSSSSDTKKTETTVTEKPTENKSSESNSTQGTTEEKGAYKDGEYTSEAVDTGHGPLQIMVTIKDGKIANIEALSIPDKDDSAKRVNSKAVPEYIKKALQSQSDEVDKVSGASETHENFNKVLKSALDKAK